MKNSEIDNRMNRWAIWCLSGRTSNIGFPREASYCRLEARGGRGLSAEFNDGAWEIDQAVRSLDDLLQTTVKIFYLGKGTTVQKAVDCGCSKVTMYNRIGSAHEKIQSWLEENRGQAGRKLNQTL